MNYSDIHTKSYAYVYDTKSVQFKISKNQFKYIYIIIFILICDMIAEIIMHK